MSLSQLFLGAPPQLLSTVALNTSVLCDPAPCVIGFAPVDFAPLGKGATSFIASTAGDYSFHGSTRVRAVELAPKMGTSPALRFSDGFQRSGPLHHSDSIMGAWLASSCAANGAKGLTIPASCTVATSTAAVALPSIFAEPLTLTLSGVVAPPRSSATLTFGEITLRLETNAAGDSSVAASACSDTHPPCHDGAGWTVALSANTVNCSLAISCPAAVSGGGATAPSAPSAPWNGQGTPHGLHCRDELLDARSGAPYDCGASTLSIATSPSPSTAAAANSAGLSIRGIALRSCLLPGNDPLRPGVTVPVYPAVLAGITDEVGFHSPPLGAAQPRADEGIIDVSAPPFSADATGVSDATVAIQAAVDYAREHYSAVYFPSGRYLVSDTIVLRAVPRTMATGHIPGPNPEGGFSSDFLLDGVSSRYVPNYILGSTVGNGATIVLAPSVFTNASNPRYVLDFFFENSAGTPEPNAQYNSIAMDLKVHIGEGNIGAVGVRLRGAQGSGLEDVEVDVGDGLAGVVGGCGSGGAHHGLTIIGGRYGLDLRESQPTGTVSGATLIGQRCAAIVYAGFESLSAVGINATAQRGCVGAVSTVDPSVTFSATGSPDDACALPPMPTGPGFPGDYQKNNPGITGKMNFIDSSFDFASGDGACVAKNTTAFRAVRSLFLQNVYIANAANVFTASDRASLPTTAKLTLVKRLVHGIDPPIDRQFQLHAAVYVDGVRQPSKSIIDVAKVPPTAVPTDLITRHRWPTGHASFEQPRCVNAKKEGAKGDGVTDDYVAIQAVLDANECVYLPRGLYVTSRTLQVHSGRSLIGVARHLTRITSMDAGLIGGPPRHAHRFRDPNATVLPVLEVLPPKRTLNTTTTSRRPAAFDSTFVAFLSVSIWNNLNTTSALHWHSGGVYRQLHCNRANRCGSLYRPGCHNSTEINYPLELVKGARDLKIYTFYDEDCCHTAETSVSVGIPGVPAYWNGFLAGPQGPLYRHLKVEQSSRLGFYHLNCEHGTGEAICEFAENSTELSVYGLKTEGRFVTLWIRDCDDVSVFGTGGAGCSANDTIYPAGFAKGYPPTLYRVERTPSFLFASLIDQHSMVAYSKYPNITDRPHDMFDEAPCPPSITHILYVDGAQTRTFDRPALYIMGTPNIA